MVWHLAMAVDDEQEGDRRRAIFQPNPIKDWDNFVNGGEAIDTP